MTRKQKQTTRKPDDVFWIQAETTQIGSNGTFLAGQLYEVTGELLSRQPDDFKYHETPAPENAYVDQDRVKVSQLTAQLGDEQAKLNLHRIRQNSLINQKRRIMDKLAEFDKHKTEDLQQPGALNRQFRIAKAELEIAECQSDQCAEDIKQAVEKTGNLEKQIQLLRNKIAQKTVTSESDDGSPKNKETENPKD